MNPSTNIKTFNLTPIKTVQWIYRNMFIVPQPILNQPANVLIEGDLTVTTINGSAYPPEASDLTAVLTAGSNAGCRSISGLHDLQVETINGTAYPPESGSIDISYNNTAGVFYPTFVNGTGTGKILYADTLITPFSINPNTGDFNVASTLKITQTTIALGLTAGQTNQHPNSLAIGVLAGNFNQGANSVSLGHGAGSQEQGEISVAIGYKAGATRQGHSSVALGNQAGTTTQGEFTVAVGRLAGETTQGESSVAIGLKAGQTNQGAYSVAIGNSAGISNQHQNTIVLNGTGTDLNTNGQNQFIVKPIRSKAGKKGFVALYWNAETGEICSA